MTTKIILYVPQPDSKSTVQAGGQYTAAKGLIDQSIRRRCGLCYARRHVSGPRRVRRRSDRESVVMDCPVGTVRSRIFRAREAIDNKLNPLIGES